MYKDRGIDSDMWIHESIRRFIHMHDYHSLHKQTQSDRFRRCMNPHVSIYHYTPVYAVIAHYTVYYTSTHEQTTTGIGATALPPAMPIKDRINIDLTASHYKKVVLVRSICLRRNTFLTNDGLSLIPFGVSETRTHHL